MCFSQLVCVHLGCTGAAVLLRAITHPGRGCISWLIHILWCYCAYYIHWRENFKSKLKSELWRINPLHNWKWANTSQRSNRNFRAASTCETPLFVCRPHRQQPGVVVIWLWKQPVHVYWAISPSDATINLGEVILIWVSTLKLQPVCKGKRFMETNFLYVLSDNHFQRVFFHVSKERNFCLHFGPLNFKMIN